MSKIANTVQSYDRKGLREELSDRIYDISPTRTPFMSNAGRTGADSTFPEWQVDALEDVDTANAYVEGNDFVSFPVIGATTRIGNRTQISAKNIIVARTVESVRKAGRKSEMAYQIVRKTKALKRDIESMALMNQGSVAGDGTTARRAASFTAFLKTNVDKDAGGTNPVYTTEPTDDYTDGSPRDFSEDIVRSVMQKCYDSGAEPTTCMVGSSNKMNFSLFPGIAEIRKAVDGASAATIIGAADIYVSDFGNLAIVPNRFMRASEALFIDFDFVKLAFLDDFDLQDLAKTGDAKKKLLICEWTVKCLNEKAHGIARDLNTTVQAA